MWLDYLGKTVMTNETIFLGGVRTIGFGDPPIVGPIIGGPDTANPNAPITRRSTQEAAVCPPGSTPTFYPDGTYQCLMPDGSVPIKPNFPLPPGFTTCGAGFELHDGRCYDPREWAALVAAGKGAPNQDATTLEKSIYAGTGVIVMGGIIWLLVR